MLGVDGPSLMNIRPPQRERSHTQRVQWSNAQSDVRAEASCCAELEKERSKGKKTSMISGGLTFLMAEGEVLEKYEVEEWVNWRYKGRGQLLMWVEQVKIEEHQKCRVNRDCVGHQGAQK